MAIFHVMSESREVLRPRPSMCGIDTYIYRVDLGKYITHSYFPVSWMDWKELHEVDSGSFAYRNSPAALGESSSVRTTSVSLYTQVAKYRRETKPRSPSQDFTVQVAIASTVVHADSRDKLKTSDAPD